MRSLSTQEFIQQVFVYEVGDLIEKHPYIAFIIMGSGIEFLGKCLETTDLTWHEGGKSRRSFNNAVKSFAALKKYEPYLPKSGHDLYGSLRCGLVHAAKPNSKVTLSSKNEMANLTEFDGRINLRCEDFYSDFKMACEEVIAKTFPAGDKMNGGFLKIPNHEMNVSANYATAVTESIAR